MSRLKKLLHENPITIIVELDENDPEFARRVESAGADAIILKSREHEKTIAKAVKIPLGIKIGKAEDQLELYDFIIFPAERLFEMQGTKQTRVVMIKEMGDLNDKADVLDAAIIPRAKTAKEMSIGDLQNYISIIISSGLPVLIPTERLIRPSEVSILADAGAKGIILTKTVFGSGRNKIEKVVSEFRIAADDLGDVSEE